MTSIRSQSLVVVTAKIFFTVLSLLLLTWVVYRVREILFLLFLSFIISSALYPPVNWLKSKKFPSHLSILVFYIAFLILLTLVAMLVSEMLTNEGRQFMLHLPQYIDQAQLTISKIYFGGKQFNLLESVSNNLRNLINQSMQVALTSLEYLFSLVKGMFGIVTVLVFTFFFLSDTSYFEKTCLRLIPLEHRSSVDGFSRRLIQKIGAYIRGQFCIMCIIGTLIWLTLSALGIPYALILGLLGFLLDAIPVVGPLVSASFGIIVALGHNPSSALLVAVAYFVIQHIESYFLGPTIIGRSLGLHPFWILMSILLSEMLLGIEGLLVAIPLGLVIALLLDEFYTKYIPNSSESTQN